MTDHHLEGIDELSRELTEEIEAHRVTRANHEAERAMLSETIDRVSAISHASYVERDAAKARAEAAEDKLAELVREVREWVQSTDEEPRGKHWAELDRMLSKHERPGGGG